jgi:hypothetical protein
MRDNGEGRPALTVSTKGSCVAASSTIQLVIQRWRMSIPESVLLSYGYLSGIRMMGCEKNRYQRIHTKIDTL